MESLNHSPSCSDYLKSTLSKNLMNSIQGCLDIIASNAAKPLIFKTNDNLI